MTKAEFLSYKWLCSTIYKDFNDTDVLYLVNILTTKSIQLKATSKRASNNESFGINLSAGCKEILYTLNSLSLTESELLDSCINLEVIDDSLCVSSNVLFEHDSIAIEATDKVFLITFKLADNENNSFFVVRYKDSFVLNGISHSTSGNITPMQFMNFKRASDYWIISLRFCRVKVFFNGSISLDIDFYSVADSLLPRELCLRKMVITGI